MRSVQVLVVVLVAVYCDAVSALSTQAAYEKLNGYLVSMDKEHAQEEFSKNIDTLKGLAASGGLLQGKSKLRNLVKYFEAPTTCDQKNHELREKLTRGLSERLHYNYDSDSKPIYRLLGHLFRLAAETCAPKRLSLYENAMASLDGKVKEKIQKTLNDKLLADLAEEILIKSKTIAELGRHNHFVAFDFAADEELTRKMHIDYAPPKKATYLGPPFAAMWYLAQESFPESQSERKKYIKEELLEPCKEFVSKLKDVYAIARDDVWDSKKTLDNDDANGGFVKNWVRYEICASTLSRKAASKFTSRVAGFTTLPTQDNSSQD